MPRYTKTRVIILIIILFLIFGGILGRGLFQKSKISQGEKVIPEKLGKEVPAEEMFSLAGMVSGVDSGNKFLMVKPVTKGEEVKVIITGETKLFKLIRPADSKEPTFTLKREEITIGDIKAGDKVFIKTNLNISGKKEFNDVNYIEVL